MEPAQIIESVNRENAELQNQKHQLLANLQETEDQLSKARTLNDTYQYEVQAQAFQMYVANETITNLNHHIYFLQSYIGRVKQQSDQAMRACRDATEYYEREIAAGRWSGY